MVGNVKTVPNIVKSLNEVSSAGHCQLLARPTDWRKPSLGGCCHAASAFCHLADNFSWGFRVLLTGQEVEGNRCGWGWRSAERGGAWSSSPRHPVAALPIHSYPPPPPPDHRSNLPACWGGAQLLHYYWKKFLPTFEIFFSLMTDYGFHSREPSKESNIRSSF